MTEKNKSAVYFLKSCVSPGNTLFPALTESTEQCNNTAEYSSDKTGVAVFNIRAVLSLDRFV